MASSRSKNDLYPVDDLRRELEAKIEKKLPIWTFSLSVVVLAGILGTIYYQTLQANSKCETLNNRIIVIETKDNLQGK